MSLSIKPLSSTPHSIPSTCKHHRVDRRLPPAHMVAIISPKSPFFPAGLSADGLRRGLGAMIWSKVGFLRGGGSGGVGCAGCLAGKGRVVEKEVGEGGVDVWNEEEGQGEEGLGFPEHLVVMVNGLGGSAQDWRYAAEQFVKRFPDRVIVHRSKCNYSRRTFDGVDVMGERLATEVLSVVNRSQGIRKISFVAHSLGGLISRYAIGMLYECPPHEPSNGSVDSLDIYSSLKGRIAGLEPVNFITVATPHLGSGGNKQLPFLCGLTFLEKSASQTAHLIAGRTGRHLFLTDNDDGKPPLLLRMADDCDDIKFRSALGSFKRRVAYANTNFDSMVGWRTSSIRRQHELPKFQFLMKDTKYPHIIYDDRGEAKLDREPSSNIEGEQQNDFEEMMIRGLTQVPWERVDVSFQKSTQRIVAHTTIQVKTYWLNSDGTDVIFHMMDNFQT